MVDGSLLRLLLGTRLADDATPRLAISFSLTITDTGNALAQAAVKAAEAPLTFHHRLGPGLDLLAIANPFRDAARQDEIAPALMAR